MHEMVRMMKDLKVQIALVQEPYCRDGELEKYCERQYCNAVVEVKAISTVILVLDNELEIMVMGGLVSKCAVGIWLYFESRGEWL